MTEETKKRLKPGPQRGTVYKKRKDYDVVKCPVCGRAGAGNVMRRWHFDRCPFSSLTIVEGIDDE